MGTSQEGPWEAAVHMWSRVVLPGARSLAYRTGTSALIWVLCTQPQMKQDKTPTLAPLRFS